VSELIQDLKFGFRTLRKSPGFTLVALATIAIGIGANAAIFSFFDAVLLKPVPYPDADRMVMVLEKRPDGGGNNISTLNYLDWAKENTVFENFAACSGEDVALTGIETPVRLEDQRVSAHFFDIFRIRPVLGRTFVDGEDQLGRDHVVILTHKLWLSQFGGDPGVIGRKIMLNGEPNTVVGVMPAGIYDRSWPKIYRPLAFTPENMSRDFHWLWSYAMLKPGITIGQARAQMDAVSKRLAHDFPVSNKGWGVKIDPFATTLVWKQLRQSLYVLMASVGMVLLIACANLANLTLARGMVREREVAIRAALGAGRGRLVRQFLTESLLLSTAGGVLGLLVAYAGMAALIRAIPTESLPSTAEVGMDGRVLLFALALSVLTGVVFGLIPAIKASRPDLTHAIKEGGPGASAGKALQGLRGALVIAEVALAFMLLSGAGLLIRSFFQMQKVDPGFDSTNVVTARIPISEKRFPSVIEFNLYLHRILDRIRALPGVRDAAVTVALPMQGWGYGMPFQIVGTKEVDTAHRPGCFFKMVSPSYFRTLGMRLERGRFLSDRDVKGAPPVTVITESMEKKFFPNENPVGKRIRVAELMFAKTELGPEIQWEVVGVVFDEKVGGLGDKDENNPGMYVSYEQSPTLYQNLVVRGAMDPAILQRSIRSAVHEVNRDQVLASMKTLDQIKSESMGSDWLRSSLLAVFGAVALLLAGLGLYGVISYSVLQRTREIGIRTALGASAANILVLIFRSGMTLTCIGLVIGIGGALALSQVLASMLFNIGKYDLVTLVAVAAILFFTALLACYIPARRAAKVDPLVALRYE